MSEGSSRSSQEGLDGLHGDAKQQTTVQRTQKVPGMTECRPHLPVTRVRAGSPVETDNPRLQLNANPSATKHLISAQGLQRASGQGVNSLSRPGKGGPGLVSEGRSPPPYNANHRLASSQSTPHLATSQQPPPQHGRSSPLQSNSDSTKGAQMMPQSPEWQDWQRERWQIWQLLSSDNADTLPETLV